MSLCLDIMEIKKRSFNACGEEFANRFSYIYRLYSECHGLEYDFGDNIYTSLEDRQFAENYFFYGPNGEEDRSHTTPKLMYYLIELTGCTVEESLEFIKVVDFYIYEIECLCHFTSKHIEKRKQQENRLLLIQGGCDDCN